MKRSASAVWQGGIKDGQGQTSTESGIISNAPYSFSNRFEKNQGTSPEELLAAAHASCYSMALSLVLGESSLTPEKIETSATVTVEPDDINFGVKNVHLVVHANVPGADKATFDAAANGAKEGCPVSRLFNTEITLEATLDS